MTYTREDIKIGLLLSWEQTYPVQKTQLAEIIKIEPYPKNFDKNEMKVIYKIDDTDESVTNNAYDLLSTLLMCLNNGEYRLVRKYNSTVTAKYVE